MCCSNPLLWLKLCDISFSNPQLLLRNYVKSHFLPGFISVVAGKETSDFSAVTAG